ncbi:hypothetical protein BaRGS_00006503 [Batillaria attramentaria]|uniref:Uncharacterized protein n=1 Tax=Batillaria attramentaria TaxID=370345 RepID=A0ABD0LRG1_9CAEN
MATHTIVGKKTFSARMFHDCNLQNVKDHIVSTTSRREAATRPRCHTSARAVNVKPSRQSSLHNKTQSGAHSSAAALTMNGAQSDKS